MVQAWVQQGRRDLKDKETQATLRAAEREVRLSAEYFLEAFVSRYGYVDGLRLMSRYCMGTL